MSRTRTRGSLAPSATVTWKHIYSNCGHTAWSNYASGAGAMTGELTTMVDEVIPDFHRRRARGEVFFNPMHSYKENYQLIPGSGFALQGINNSCNSPVYKHQVDHSDTMSWICGPNGKKPDVYSVFTSDAIEALKTEVSTSMYNKRGRTDTNLWDTLAEAHKASQLIPGMARRAANVITVGANRAKRNLRKEAYASAEDLSSLWLQYRYGLRPIIKDVGVVLENIHNVSRRVRKTTRAGDSMNGSLSWKTTWGPADGGVKVDYLGTYSDQVLIRAASLDEFTLNAASDIGLTTKGLLTLPWELIPYSFVVDWFLNVGDYFGSLVPAFGYNHLGASLTVERVRCTTYMPQQTYMNAGSSYVVTRSVSGGVVATTHEKYRTSPNVPGIVIKSDFRFDTFTRAADAFSLVGQKLARIMRVR